MSTSYDRVPYKSYPFPQSHPDRLGTIATLLGGAPRKLAKARVLELACASGGNLIPLADQFPHGEYVGVDASGAQIAEGQKLVDALGLTNVRLLHVDIRDFDESLGEFDYIIAHGVFSWVPTDVRHKILAICEKHLAPHGVAYISYNAYPGWRFRGMIRDVMTYHARFYSEPQSQLHEARSLVAFLAQSVPTKDNPYGLLLNDELKLLEQKEDYYLLHEYLEDDNSPLYFHEFCELAAAHNLQYLGEADYSMMSVNNLPPEVAARLKQLTGDVVRMEQYMDFVRNRMFRQTLLCRNDVLLERNPSPERVVEMWVASNAQPESEIIQLRSRDKVTFRRPGSTMTTVEPLVKAAMLYLRRMWPQWVSFRELLSAARGMLSNGPMILDAAREHADALALAQPLLKCYGTSHVDLAFDPPRPNFKSSERPRASMIARQQSLSSATVTNLRHESITLTDLQRHVLRALDGTRDRAGILDELVELVRQGTLVLQENGRAQRDLDRARDVLDSVLDENLTTIAGRALLLPEE